ncbi:MAG: SAM-dependent methyltransferase [Alphaproteobacteria bacterium]|nr:SAM-dependent methyltransferase [Alphaproteobacteria bacterium]
MTPTAAPVSGFMSMKGGGYYSRATVGARHVIDGATGLVLDALERMAPDDDGTVFTMADMGCADGGTSLGMVVTVLGELRRRLPSRPLQMVYTDLPRNDFSELFRTVLGSGHLDGIGDLSVFASGTSFHRPIFPPSTLNLGFSATASHYTDAVPCAISGHVHMVGATDSERAAWVEQGRLDWERILTSRARDLAAGGRLVLVNFGIDEAGRYLGATGGVNMFDMFNTLWAELRDDGAITSDEYAATNFPQCYRTVDEFAAPFSDPGGPVRGAGLVLEHVETRVVRCPFAVAFGEHGDAARFAREYIPTLRSWSEATFAAGLAPSRPGAERRAILDRFYDTYELRVRTSPDGHAMDYVHCYLVAAKT